MNTSFPNKWSLKTSATSIFTFLYFKLQNRTKHEALRAATLIKTSAKSILPISYFKFQNRTKQGALLIPVLSPSLSPPPPPPPQAKSKRMIYKPAIAAMHGPHSLVRIGLGCAGDAKLMIGCSLVRFGN